MYFATIKNNPDLVKKRKGDISILLLMLWKRIPPGEKYMVNYFLIGLKGSVNNSFL